MVGGGRLKITGLLLCQFSWPVLVANAIAWPVTYWMMSAWLQNFARRAELNGSLFAVSGLFTLTMAIAAVVTHTWRMAGTRPVEALRHE